MVDWFPFRGSFRLSGGVTVYNNKGVSGTVTCPTLRASRWATTSIMLAARFPAAQYIKLGGNAGGRVSFGCGNLVPKKGHHFSFDTELGIEFVSAPTVALGFSGNICTSAQCPGSEKHHHRVCLDLCPILGGRRHGAKQVQNDVNFVKFYPILSFGIGYRIH